MRQYYLFIIYDLCIIQYHVFYSADCESASILFMKLLFPISAFLLCISGVQAATTLYETQFQQTTITSESDFLNNASVSITNPSTSISGGLAANLLVPNLQMNGNTDGWTLTFSFTASQDITISALELGFQFVNASGAQHSNSDPKEGTATITLAAGSSSSTAGMSFERPQEDKGSNTPTADIQEASFNAPLTVKGGETFTLTVNAKAPNTGGTYLGLSQLSVQGDVVPEPATTTLSLFGLATLFLRRRV